ncbi:hypothetical protein [Vibrio fluvialis]|uniref:hypothetical protein n=1 Tax=Vibrio fluvialis TaxID=676 RepID=UPI0013023A72|nr:hypothetical protein [Vibrio fluvialis]ELS8946782.1 hypothetical protein [Vibrio fluvialis]MCG6385168.1 hypothetical protein [Vibrio fluvialis]
MKAKKITSKFDEPAQEPKIDEFVKNSPPSPRLGLIMNVAIYAYKIDSYEAPEPYRTFKTVGKEEYFSLCEFLESIGLVEYPHNAEKFDAVFCESEPTYDVEFYNEGMF